MKLCNLSYIFFCLKTNSTYIRIFIIQEKFSSWLLQTMQVLFLVEAYFHCLGNENYLFLIRRLFVFCFLLGGDYILFKEALYTNLFLFRNKLSTFFWGPAWLKHDNLQLPYPYLPSIVFASSLMQRNNTRIKSNALLGGDFFEKIFCERWFLLENVWLKSTEKSRTKLFYWIIYDWK